MQPKVNILFIEDERNILTFVRKLLYGHNYKVTTAITGTEGLQLINSICPDLILLDLGLPDMDGQTIIRQVREWSDCPIIVISARTNEHEKVKALDLGADDYITKPFGSAELLARIRTSLRHSTRMNSSSDQLTGDMSAKPLVDGACSYARALDNCVAFGALLPDQPDLMHQTNECLELDKLDLWMKIYLDAIYRLAK